MHVSSPAVRRICLAVDVEGYSRRLMADQYDLQNRLLFTMSQGCIAAGVKPGRCDRQNSGDGQILIFPPGIDEKAVLPNLVLGLLTALHRVNDPVGPGGRVRLRISLGEGAVQTAATGFVSKALEAVCRLLDSDRLRRALAGSPAAEAAVVVTDALYRDIVAQGYGGLPAAGFQRVRVSIPKKKFSADAWIQVPDVVPWLPDVPRYPDTSQLQRRQQAEAAALGAAGAAALAWAYFVSQGQHSGGPLTETAGESSHPSTSSADDPHDSHLSYDDSFPDDPDLHDPESDDIFDEDIDGDLFDGDGLSPSQDDDDLDDLGDTHDDGLY
jgi:hypothetical protein